MPAIRVRWERLDAPGADAAKLYRVKRTWHIQGNVESIVEGMPVRIAYHVGCGADWSTRIFSVSVRSEAFRRRLGLVVDTDLRWSLLGEERPDLAGCTDVDLFPTPATNTVPIRRLNLEVGRSAEVLAAWVRAPNLVVAPLRQRYTRLAEDRYRYESLGSGFTAEITVDEHGLITDYPGFWARAPGSVP